MSFGDERDDAPVRPTVGQTPKPDRSRLGRRSRAKGRRWEQEVARLLRPLFGADVKRGLQSRGGGKETPDVVGVPDHVEAKHGRVVSLWAALAQAIRDTDGRPPVVIAKLDRTEPVAVMRLSDWLALVAASRPLPASEAAP